MYQTRVFHTSRKVGFRPYPAVDILRVCCGFDWDDSYAYRSKNSENQIYLLLL